MIEDRSAQHVNSNFLRNRNSFRENSTTAEASPSAESRDTWGVYLNHVAAPSRTRRARRTNTSSVNGPPETALQAKRNPVGGAFLVQSIVAMKRLENEFGNGCLQADCGFVGGVWLQCLCDVWQVA